MLISDAFGETRTEVTRNLDVCFGTTVRSPLHLTFFYLSSHLFSLSYDPFPFYVILSPLYATFFFSLHLFLFSIRPLSPFLYTTYIFLRIILLALSHHLPPHYPFLLYVILFAL